MQENAWAAFHIWDRTQRAASSPKGTFRKQPGGALLESLHKTPGGANWWGKAKHVGFHPGFVFDVDAMLSKTSGRVTMERAAVGPLKGAV